VLLKLSRFTFAFCDVPEFSCFFWHDLRAKYRRGRRPARLSCQCQCQRPAQRRRSISVLLYA
jgi:hypothetical protein